MRIRMLPHKKMVELPHHQVQHELALILPPDIQYDIALVINMYKILLAYTRDKVENWVKSIKKRAERKQYKIHPYRRACHRMETACLGKLPVHYPYFRVTKPYRGYIEDDAMRDFLRELEFSEEEIELAKSWFNALSVLYCLYHGTLKGLDWLGIIEVPELREGVLAQYGGAKQGEQQRGES